MMAPPCDAACMKIIINTGFMAALAPRLVERLGHGDGHENAQDAAVSLTEAAQVHSEMLAAAGLTPSFDDFTGCEQAQRLIRWITGPAVDESAAEQMDKWTADIWSAIADLAAGKMPT